MHILTKLSPNNKFQIKRYRIADGYLSKKTSPDSRDIRENEYIGQKAVELLQRQKVVAANATSGVSQVSQAVPFEGQLDLFSPPPPTIDKICYAPYSALPTEVEYAATTKTGEVFVEKESYQEFASTTAATLDLLKKSQQAEKPHCSWGKLQRKKVFRYQAGQKIKEGGAIIDRFCGKENSSMLTLTLPGGTTQALAALSRWSGWIVNRMLQEVRRVPKTEPPVYWFFVWEHQKRGALHLHFCLGWKVHWAKRELLGMKLKDKWFKCLLEIYDKEGIDCFAREGFRGSWMFDRAEWRWDYQEIKKSVAAYFAKYCKKNAEYNGAFDKNPDRTQENDNQRTKTVTRKGKLFYPSRYWGSSKTVKDWAKYLTREQSYTTFSESETEEVCSRIRQIALTGFDFESVTVTPFQCLDEKSGACISSGEVETYRIHPSDFPRFWANVVENVFERDIRMDARSLAFLGKEMFR